MRQHVPRGIRDCTTSGHLQMLDSAICEHLNAINACAANYNDEYLVGLHKARTKQHLNVHEAVYILFNCPSLCERIQRTPYIYLVMFLA